MSSIVAHALAGACVAELGQREPEARADTRRAPGLVALGVLCALAADVDTLLAATFGPEHVRWLALDPAGDPHRGLTHTLPFALALGALVARLARPRGEWRGAAFVLALCAVSHLLLDALASGPPLHWLWPLSRRGFEGLGLLPAGFYSFSFETLARSLTDARFAGGMLFELALFLPLWLLARWRRAPAALAAWPVLTLLALRCLTGVLEFREAWNGAVDRLARYDGVHAWVWASAQGRIALLLVLARTLGCVAALLLLVTSWRMRKGPPPARGELRPGVLLALLLAAPLATVVLVRLALAAARARGA
jgi:membrane-bound metal-dependent hydrolase YbcI (DUF457 family)